MKKEVYSCRTNDPLYRAAEIMAAENIGFLPVQDSLRRLVGVVTDRDLVVRALANRLDFYTPIERVMTRELIWCKALDAIEKAEEEMGAAQVSRIPVVDDFGECVGIISLSDIAQSRTFAESGALLEKVTERESTWPLH
jgi:CBS domain-containing protein